MQHCHCHTLLKDVKSYYMGYGLCLSVCLSACMSVNKIDEKLLMDFNKI